MSNTNGNTLKYRVEQLEKNYDRLDDKIERIMENHLPHIQRDIISLKTRVTVATGVNIAAIILGVLIAKYL